MRILFDIGHPAHVHLFRNFISYLKNTHELTVTTRSKDVTNDLLKHYDIPFVSLTNPSKGLFSILAELTKRNLAILNLHRKHKFEAAFGTSVSICHLSVVSKVKSYNFNEDDDNVVKAYAYLSYPFATKIINPDCMKFDKWKRKRVLYPSYHELAYLHPGNFRANENIVKKYKLEPGKYIIVRNSALKAYHDVGAKGLEGDVWDNVYNIIKDHELVYSREGEKSHQIDPWDMHHILAFAKMVISDSQTMTAEAAVLGVPAIRYNSFVGKISYLEELEHKYGLTCGFKPGEESEMITKLKSLLSNDNLAEEWNIKKKFMLGDKVDLNEWMIKFFEENIK